MKIHSNQINHYNQCKEEIKEINKEREITQKEILIIQEIKQKATNHQEEKNLQMKLKRKENQELEEIEIKRVIKSIFFKLMEGL